MNTAKRSTRMRQEGMLLLLLAATAALSVSCSKKPQDSNVQSKWVILNKGQEIDNRGIAFADSLYGFALHGSLASHHTYWRTTDGGRNWDLDTLPSHPNLGLLWDLAFVNRSNVWLVGDVGLIYHTLDGGQSWTVDDRFYDRPGYPKIKKVFFADSLHGWIGIRAFGASQIARTTDAGRSWRIVSESSRRLLQALNKDVAFAEVAWGARISRTIDGGETWNEIYPGIENQLSRVEVSFINESAGWAAVNWQTEYTYGGFIIATQDAGVTWDTLLVVDSGSLDNIRMLSTGEGWMTHHLHGMLHTVDGKNWINDPLPDIGDRSVTRLVVLPDAHAWAVAGQLILKRSRD